LDSPTRRPGSNHTSNFHLTFLRPLTHRYSNWSKGLTERFPCHCSWFPLRLPCISIQHTLAEMANSNRPSWAITRPHSNDRHTNNWITQSSSFVCNRSPARTTTGMHRIGNPHFFDIRGEYLMDVLLRRLHFGPRSIKITVFHLRKTLMWLPRIRSNSGSGVAYSYLCIIMADLSRSITRVLMSYSLLIAALDTGSGANLIWKYEMPEGSLD
jgi:hypothetical protein